MKIGIVSKLWEPTCPKSTGGTGSSVGTLVESLAKRGHNVTLFASSDSTKKVNLISNVSSSDFRNNYSESLEYFNIAQAFDKKWDFDIIHCHTEYKSLFFDNIEKTPVLHTIRYGEFFDHEKQVLNYYKNRNFAGISQFVKQMLPELNWQGIIYNGIDLNLFPFNENKQDYLLFLARLTPQKGPDVAIRVAKKLGMKLILAGKKSCVDKKYLSEKVDPFIDNDQIEYVGEANFETKINLLKNAQCLLTPLAKNYIEAFGITLIEAMACGTPIVSLGGGAISEVIKDQETGFIVKTEDEIIEAVKNIDKISKEACRKRVEENFTVEKMTNGYEKLYNKIVNSK